MRTPEQYSRPNEEFKYVPTFEHYMQHVAPRDYEGFTQFMHVYTATELRLTPTGNRVGTLYMRDGFNTDTPRYASFDYDDTLTATVSMRVMRNKELGTLFNILGVNGTVEEQDSFMSAAHNFCSPGGIHNHIDLLYVLAHLSYMLTEAKNDNHPEKALAIPPEAVSAYLIDIKEHPDPMVHPFYYDGSQLMLTPAFKGKGRLVSTMRVMLPLLFPTTSHVTSAYQALRKDYNISTGILSVGHPQVQPYRIYKTFEADNVVPPDIICIAEKHKGDALTALFEQGSYLTNPDLHFVHVDDMTRHLTSLFEAHDALVKQGRTTIFTPMRVDGHNRQAAFSKPWQNRLARMTIQAATPTKGVLPPEARVFDANAGQEEIVRTILRTLGYQGSPNSHVDSV